MSVTRGIALIVVAAAIVGGKAYAQAVQTPTNSAPNPYRTIADWAKMPVGRTWGSTGGAAVDSHDNIWVAERCGANSCAGSQLAPILEFDPSGKLVKSFGAGMFVFPHGITVDRSDNVWVTDGLGQDGKGQQVFKFNSDGKVLLTLGKAGVAGTGPDEFNKPSAVAIAPNGDVFVADGHGGDSNARVVKFSKDGTLSRPGARKVLDLESSMFRIASRSIPRGACSCATATTTAIQIFDQDGTYLGELKQYSRPSSIVIDKAGTIYVADSESESVSKNHYGWKRGIRVGNLKDGSVTAFIPDPNLVATSTSSAEGIAVDSKGVIYGAEVGQKDVKKYVRQ